MTTCEQSAADDGWFFWLGAWFHIYPWETANYERPHYIIGSARDVCLLQGLDTGERLL
jgi:hypothetical protein